MQKSFLLLRHNQQSGPYSLDELSTMSLQKSKDLIWVIGQSAGWSYPEEIGVLQRLVGAGPEFSTDKETKFPKSTTADNNTGVIEQQSVRHIYVSLPVHNSMKATVTDSTPAITEVSTLSFEERVDRMRQRAVNINTPSTNAQEVEVDVKYTRSLEDIKAEYSNWMQTQKRKRKYAISKKQLGLGAVVIASAGAIWAASYFLTLPTFNKVNLQSSNTLKSTSTDTYTTASAVQQPVENKAQQIPTKRKSIDQRERLQPSVERSSVTISKRVPVTPIDKEKPAVSSKPEYSSSNSNDDQTSVAAQLQIDADYITNRKQDKGISGLAVTLKNTSNQVMKMVAVDVIYYANGMEPIDREILYFSNVHPGQVLTQNASAHKKAEGAYAKLGLVSSEEGQIYYASNK